MKTMAGDIGLSEVEYEILLREQCLRRCVGSANQCPLCGKRGFFGSISRVTMNSATYLVCGWCEKISRVGLEEEYDEQ